MTSATHAAPRAEPENRIRLNRPSAAPDAARGRAGRRRGDRGLHEGDADTAQQHQGGDHTDGGAGPGEVPPEQDLTGDKGQQPAAHDPPWPVPLGEQARHGRQHGHRGREGEHDEAGHRRRGATLTREVQRHRDEARTQAEHLPEHRQAAAQEAGLDDQAPGDERVRAVGRPPAEQDEQRDAGDRQRDRVRPRHLGHRHHRGRCDQQGGAGGQAPGAAPVERDGAAGVVGDARASSRAAPATPRARWVRRSSASRPRPR